MKVGEYKVFWQHLRHFGNGVYRTNKKNFTSLCPKGGVTQCTIEKDRNEISCALAECSENDNYNKNIGRKISLQRALNNLNLSKGEKQEFWNVYLGRK